MNNNVEHIFINLSVLEKIINKNNKKRKLFSKCEYIY